MTSKKKPPAKKPAVSAKKTITTKPTSTAKADKASSVVPFSPFITDFSNNNQTMETLMNTQKNHFEKFSTDQSEQAKQASDSIMKAGTVYMKGVEQMMKTWMSMAQETSEKNANAMKQLMACKTINDFTEAQNKLAQQNFDDMMQNATKLSEICIKLCTEACDPLNDQLSKAIKKASEQMAA
jgi:phasin family protein